MVKSLRDEWDKQIYAELLRFLFFLLDGSGLDKVKLNHLGFYLWAGVKRNITEPKVWSSVFFPSGKILSLG